MDAGPHALLDDGIHFLLGQAVQVLLSTTLAGCDGHIGREQIVGIRRRDGSIILKLLHGILGFGFAAQIVLLAGTRPAYPDGAGRQSVALASDFLRMSLLHMRVPRLLMKGEGP